MVFSKLGVNKCHVFLPRWCSTSPFERERSPREQNGFEPSFSSILQQNKKEKTLNTTTTGDWALANAMFSYHVGAALTL